MCGCVRCVCVRSKMIEDGHRVAIPPPIHSPSTLRMPLVPLPGCTSLCIYVAGLTSCAAAMAVVVVGCGGEGLGIVPMRTWSPKQRKGEHADVHVEVAPFFLFDYNLLAADVHQQQQRYQQQRRVCGGRGGKTQRHTIRSHAHGIAARCGIHRPPAPLSLVAETPATKR